MPASTETFRQGSQVAAAALGFSWVRSEGDFHPLRRLHDTDDVARAWKKRVGQELAEVRPFEGREVEQNGISGALGITAPNKHERQTGLA